MCRFVVLLEGSHAVMVTGVYYSENFGGDLSNFNILPRIIDNVVRGRKQNLK